MPRHAIQDVDGKICIYEKCALKQINLSDNSKQFFEGPSGKEYLIRILFPNGLNWYYEGEKGFERVVRKEIPCGHIDCFKDFNKPACCHTIHLNVDETDSGIYNVELCWGGIITNKNDIIIGFDLTPYQFQIYRDITRYFANLSNYGMTQANKFYQENIYLKKDVEEKLDESPIQNTYCSICNKSFKSKAYLAVHEKSKNHKDALKDLFYKTFPESKKRNNCDQLLSSKKKRVVGETKIEIVTNNDTVYIN
jgi:hypothetical protein